MLSHPPRTVYTEGAIDLLVNVKVIWWTTCSCNGISFQVKNYIFRSRHRLSLAFQKEKYDRRVILERTPPSVIYNLGVYFRRLLLRNGPYNCILHNERAFYKSDIHLIEIEIQKRKWRASVNWFVAEWNFYMDWNIIQLALTSDRLIIKSFVNWYKSDGSNQDKNGGLHSGTDKLISLSFRITMYSDAIQFRTEDCWNRCDFL